MKFISSIIKFFKPDGVQVAFFGAFLVFVVVVAVMMMSGTNKEILVNYQPDAVKKRQPTKVQAVQEARRAGEDDPQVKYAERLKEAASLGTGLAFFVINERMNGVETSDINALLAKFEPSGLLPPALWILKPTTAVQYGVVRSQRGLYLIRYRSRPLLIEIIASGDGGFESGAFFVVRLPDTASSESLGKVNTAGHWASVYIAPENVSAVIPPPFSPADYYRQFGWQTEPLRYYELPSAQAQAVEQFLLQQKQ